MGEGKIGRLGLTYTHYYIIDTEKAMASHSRTLAWKIPWMEEPGRLQSMGLQRVVHDGASEQPPPVILHSETLGNFITLIFLIYFGIMFKNSSISIVLN